MSFRYQRNSVELQVDYAMLPAQIGQLRFDLNHNEVLRLLALSPCFAVMQPVGQALKTSYIALVNFLDNLTAYSSALNTHVSVTVAQSIVLAKIDRTWPQLLVFIVVPAGSDCNFHSSERLSS